MHQTSMSFGGRALSSLPVLTEKLGLTGQEVELSKASRGIICGVEEMSPPYGVGSGEGLPFQAVIIEVYFGR